MGYVITRILVHIICFFICFYALEAVDFARFIRRNEVGRARLLLVLFSMALGYLVAQFILALMYTL